MESILVTLGETRPLLQTEYEMIFRNFPGLKDAFASRQWPKERVIPDDELSYAKRELQIASGLLATTDEDVALGEHVTFD